MKKSRNSLLKKLLGGCQQDKKKYKKYKKRNIKKRDMCVMKGMKEERKEI